MKLFKSKKVILILLSLFLSFSFVTTSLISSEAQKENVYKIIVPGEKDARSGSSAIFIKSISIGETNMPLNSYEDKKNFTIYGNYLVGEKKDNSTSELIVKSSKINDVKIDILESVNSGKILLEVNNKITNLNLYHNGDADYYYEHSYRILDILNSQFAKMSFLGYLGLISLFGFSFIILYLACSTFYDFILNINEDNLKTLDILKAIISLFLIFLSCAYLLMKLINIFILIPIAVLLIYGLLFNKKIIMRKLEYAFVYIGIVVGISLLFILPPFQVPDEAAHFVKSYELLDTNKNKEVIPLYEGRKDEFIYLPVNIYNFIGNYTHSILSSTYTLSSKGYFYDLLQRTNYSNITNKVFWYGNTSHSFSLPYLPSSLMIFLGKFFCLSPLLLLLLGKLIDFSISLLMCYYAIKIVRSFKKTFFIVALFPIFIYQSVAFNMDWLTNASFILLTALIVNEIYGKSKIEMKKIFNILLVSIVLAFCKFGYFPIALLILLIPSIRFKNKKNEVYMKTLLILPLILISSYQYVMMRSIPPTTTDYYRFSIIFNEPLKYLSMNVNTFVQRIDLDMFRGLFNGFGWSTVWHNSLNAFLLFVIYIILIFSSDDKSESLSKKQRVLFIAIAVIIIGILYTAMLFSWTKIGWETIDGLQPRYFIPAALMFYIGISNKYINLNVKNRNICYSISTVLIYIICFYTIIHKFYVG